MNDWILNIEVNVNPLCGLIYIKMCRKLWAEVGFLIAHWIWEDYMIMIIIKDKNETVEPTRYLITEVYYVVLLV